MLRIPGDDTAATAGGGLGIVLGQSVFLSNHSSNRRCAQDESSSGQHQRHPLETHRREQTLQLPHEENPHALGWGVVWPTPGSGAFPTAIFDAKLLQKERDLGVRLFEFDLEATPWGSAATGARENHPGERNGVEEAGFHVIRPLGRQADRLASCHSGLRLKSGRSQS